MMLDPAERSIWADMMLERLVGDECRICGRPITHEDIDDEHGVRFAGQHEPGKQAAHARCWAGMLETVLDAPAARLEEELAAASARRERRDDTP